MSAPPNIVAVTLVAFSADGYKIERSKFIGWHKTLKAAIEALEMGSFKRDWRAIIECVPEGYFPKTELLGVYVRARGKQHWVKSPSLDDLNEWGSFLIDSP